jgi:hypothetical protein
MNMPPVCVLGSWIGTAKEWAAFSDCWAEALWMKPRVDYFKLAEAQNLTGQFNGWSEQSRDERLRVLVKTIERHKLLGVTNAIPYDAHKEIFGDLPDKGVQDAYFISFFGIIALLAGYHQKQGHNEQIDFIFDIQPGQVEIVTAAWNRFKEVAPPNLRPLIGDYPIFRNDKTTLPLQAADLGVGWSRQLAEDYYYGRANRTPPWGIKVDIQVIGRYWTKEMLIELLSTLNLSGGSFVLPR